MALHKIEVGKYDSPNEFRRSCSAIEVIQIYSRLSNHDLIVPKQTYAQCRFFDSRQELALNIVRPDFIESLKRDLKEQALEMHFKGFVVSGFGIGIGNSDQVFSVDAFDQFHMKKIVEFHQLMPKRADPESAPEL